MWCSIRKCCVPGCMDAGHMEMPLHSFPNPIKDKERFETWVRSIKADEVGMDRDNIKKHGRVCHSHFEAKFRCRYGRLSNVAVPTLKLPGLLTVLKCSNSERRPLKQLQNANIAGQPKGLFDTDVELPMSPYTSTSCSTHVDIIKENIGVFDTDIAVPCTSSHASSHVHADIQKIGVFDTDIAVPCTSSHASSHVHADIQKIDGEKAAAGIRKKAIQRRTANITSKMIGTLLERRLYFKLKQVIAKVNKLRNRAKQQKASLKAAKKITSNPGFVEAMEKMTNTAKILTMLQFRETKKKEKGRRFSVEEKIIGLSIMKKSPKCYRFLRKIFTLPAPQTLAKLISKANIEPGINKKIFAQIKKATEKMKLEDRLCILLFDEMSLKANLTYNERKDKVLGFVTDGRKTEAVFADHAQVFMVRGLIRNYKQPVSYTFAASATSGPELAKQLKEVIKELQEAGLIVVATVADQGSNNRNAIKLLLQETRGDFLRAGIEPKENVFVVNNQTIIPLYDPPHLIKCIRNNLITKNLTYVTNDGQAQTAKWEHIEMLHKENPGYKGIRLIPKLTDCHVIPSKISKMKVKFATQLFSCTVASNMGYLADKGILPNECKETADILVFFDELFDSVNGSYPKSTKKHGKPLLGPVKPNSAHKKFWFEAKKKIKTMKFVNKSGKMENVPTIDNWINTLDGIELLVKKMENDYKITSLWMRHLNQDPIENFFGAVRSHGCRNTNPTPERFESAFTALLINSLSGFNSPGTNCEQDDCVQLTRLQDLIHESRISDCKAPLTYDIENAEVELTPFEDKNQPHIIGALQYVCGYFVKKTKTNVFKGCIQCQKDLMNTQEPEYIKYREYVREKRWLCSPSDALLRVSSNLQDIIHCVLKKNLNKNNLKELVKTIIFATMMEELDIFKCEIHKNQIIDYLLNLTCRFFIYNYCKEINKILDNKRQCDDETDDYKIKAKMYFHKCLKRKNK